MPRPPEVIDRDALGRFGPGNRAGRGNPQAARVAALRSAMLEAVTPDDLREVVAVLVKRAKQGNLAAIREVLDRTVGKAATPLDVLVDATPAAGPLGMDDATRRTMVALMENPATREVLIRLGEEEGEHLIT